jgi:hypothetical protein
MSGSRLFSYKPEVKISAAEGIVLMDAYEKIKGKRVEIGFIIQEIVQEALDAAVARFTMQLDKEKE